MLFFGSKILTQHFFQNLVRHYQKELYELSVDIVILRMRNKNSSVLQLVYYDFH